MALHDDSIYKFFHYFQDQNPRHRTMTIDPILREEAGQIELEPTLMAEAMVYTIAVVRPLFNKIPMGLPIPQLICLQQVSSHNQVL